MKREDKNAFTPKHNFTAFFRQVGQIQLFPTKEVNIYLTEIKQFKSAITLMLSSRLQEPRTDNIHANATEHVVCVGVRDHRVSFDF